MKLHPSHTTEIHTYHITSRCKMQEFFPLPMGETWEIIVWTLFKLHKKSGLAIHAFVLMGNHFHLLCHAKSKDVVALAEVFLDSTSQIIADRARTGEDLWEDEFKVYQIDSHTNYLQVYRYIHQNPLRAGLTLKVEDYAYSSLKPVPFPLHTYVPMAFGGHEGEYLWLNATAAN